MNKIYDTHSDIFHNLFTRKEEGCIDPFEKYHLENLTKGNVLGGIWVVYGDKDFDVYPAYKKALEVFEPYKDKYDVIYGLEGLRNVHTLDDLKKMYDLGIRHASLTWNEENHLATGVAGPADRGLTDLGKEFLDFMQEHKMIIDVSHLNVKSFYDVCEYVKTPIIASHSNAYTLCNHRRNLNDDQLRVLKEKGGYVGVVSARNFVSPRDDRKTVAGLVDHIEYIANIIGIDHVMLGLDMMDYLDDFNDHNSNLDDLVTHADANNVVTEMRRRGFKEEDINKVTHENYFELLKKVGVKDEK